MGGSTPKQHVTTTTQDTKTDANTNEERLTTGASTGQTAAATAGASEVSLPEYLQSLIQGVPGVSAQALQDLQTGTQGFQLPSEAMETLRATAGGDYLYGGPQQQAFVDASVRSAMPGINSAFGTANRGGGGLYNAAIGQAGVDAFAGLFNQERGRQMQAAELLPKMQSMPLALQQQLLDSASLLPSRFSPLFGQTNTGTSVGQTAGTSREEMEGKSQSSSSSSSVGTSAQPIYETPWWQTALGGATTLAGLAMPGLSGVSALGNMASGLFGSTAMQGMQGGGLLGLFR